jgi:riboflavin-specific deaminase-like protein
MHKIEMNDRDWSQILALRQWSRGHGARNPYVDASEPSFGLYGPLAAATGHFVLAQVGQSLDGRVATPSGDAHDISGCDGIAHLHRCRALVDAVIVGVGTVLADDPRLSVRAVKGISPVRVVIDCNGDLKGDEKLLQDRGAPVIVIRADDAPDVISGAEIIRIRRGENGLHPLDIIDALSARGLTRILVEGGARTIARFIDAGLVDRLHISIAPIIIGSGPAGISLPPVQLLSQAYRPKVTAYDIGSDVVFDCELRPGVAEHHIGLSSRKYVHMADDTATAGVSDRIEAKL